MKVSSRLWGYVLKVVSGLFISVFLTQYKWNWEISEVFSPKLKFYPMKMLRNLLWVVLSKRLLTWAVNVETRGSAALRCETAIPEWHRFYIKERQSENDWNSAKKSTKSHMEWVRMCQMDNSLALSQFWFFFFHV